MFYSEKLLASNPRLAVHMKELNSQRKIWEASNSQMVANYKSAMTPEMLAANATGFGVDFWREIDRDLVESRLDTTGMEIVDDLLAVQTVLDIGKTAKLYRTGGDIADDVSVSIDGQAPYTFDHTEGSTDGDPVPVFTAGYGVNWRLARGLSSVGIDLVLESQRAKQDKYNKAVVNYALNGDDHINVAGYQAQGLKNHRNTKKVDLGAGGANIDLTTATAVELIDFFTKGSFGTTARNNGVDAYDVLWVSYDIWANMAQAYVVNGAVVGTVLSQVVPFAPVREVRPTFALSGNEYLAYQRRRNVVTPLVGMATGVIALPRPLPQHNFNFQIMGAMGIQVKADEAGRGGVQYGAVLA